mmetsp:Transcript_23370/g.41192  ORF Transcript_23370/g.41192 Transcript_23370/m.41192 type:complete len:111 (+) Transcript_23370:60-392(+)
MSGIRRPRARRSDDNVRELVKKEMAVASAMEDLRDRKVAEARAEWETKHQQSTNREADARLEQACEAELRFESENLVRARRARLQALYAAEEKAYEEELAENGLARFRSH